jgi:hypothetical protein
MHIPQPEQIMQNQSSTVQPKANDKQGQTPATPLPAPQPLSPELLQQIGGAGGPRALPKGGW